MVVNEMFLCCWPCKKMHACFWQRKCEFKVQVHLFCDEWRDWSEQFYNLHEDIIKYIKDHLFFFRSSCCCFVPNRLNIGSRKFQKQMFDCERNFVKRIGIKKMRHVFH